MKEGRIRKGSSQSSGLWELGLFELSSCGQQKGLGEVGCWWVEQALTGWQIDDAREVPQTRLGRWGLGAKRGVSHRGLVKVIVVGTG